MRPLRLAREVIDFQTDNIGEQIQAIFTTIQNELKDNPEYSKLIGVIAKRKLLAKSEYKKMLEDLIFKRFGIKTNVDFTTNCLGAIMPLWANDFNVLIKPFWRGELKIPDQTKLIKSFNEKKGTVDLKHAKVGGVFSEYVHKLWLDPVGGFSDLGVTPGELTAVLLHEIGHAFTFYEFSNRLSTTNQVLAALGEEVRGKNDKTKRAYLFKEIATINDLNEKEFEELIEEENNLVLGAKLFRKYIEIMKSQMPNDKYTDTASEQLADNFATRCGYGRELITGLDKFYRGMPDRNRASFVLAFIASIVIPGLAVGGVILGVMIGNPLVLAYCLFLAMMFLFGNGEANEDMTYDRIKIRYQRVRDQLLQQLKDFSLDKEATEKIIESIKTLDEVISKTSIYRPAMAMLVNFIAKRHRDTKSDIEMQQLIESLSHNNLFLKSAELRVAGESFKPGSVKEEWQRLEAWLRHNDPGMLKNLNPPATSAEIHEIEKAIGKSLPADFVECLKVHNGQRPVTDGLFPFGEFMSLKDVLSSWQTMHDLDADGDFDGKKSKPDPEIKEGWWLNSWVPFAANGGGDHLCLDLDPSPHGQKGQVIQFWHDDGTRRKKANSFAEWFTEFVNKTVQ